VVGFARAFFPQLDHYKSYFEQWASKALHQPVKIAYIQTSWKGFHPVVNMQEVDVLDSSTHQSRLHIQRLQIGLSVIATLLERRFVPSSITVFGTRILVEHRNEHELRVNGIPVPVAMNATSHIELAGIMGWLLKLGNIRLEDIDLDWKQGSRLLQFKGLTLGLNHGFFKDQIIGAATLVNKLPTQFRFVINLTGSNPEQIRAECYLFLKDFNISSWRKELPSDLYLTQGTLEHLQLWGVWGKNQWQRLQAQFALNQAQLSPPTLNTPLQIDELDANVFWQRETEAFSFAADHIKLVLNQQLWPVREVGIQEAKIGKGEQAAVVQIVRVDALDLKQLSQQLAFSGGGDKKIEALTEPLTALAPQGKLNNLLIRHEISVAGDSTLSASTRFSALKTQAWREIPAIEGLQGSLRFTPTAGDLQLNNSGTPLDLDASSWFSRPIRLNFYRGHIQWAKQAEGLAVQVADLAMANDDLGARADINLFLPSQKEQSPYIQLLAAFSEQDNRHLRDYVPVGLLKRHPILSNWLTEAFVAGDGIEGQILLRGPLTHFPFDDHTGKFEAKISTRNTELNYKTGWPSIEHLNASAFFDGRTLTIEAAPGATILGTTMESAKAQIPDLSNSMLAVQGRLRGDMRDGLQFITESPLQKTIGEGLEHLTFSGGMNLMLELHIPLYKGNMSSTVQGDVSMPTAGQLDIPAWNVHLTDFKGAFRFTESSLSSDKLTAKWLGEPLEIRIDTSKTADKNNTIQVYTRGHAIVANILHAYGLNHLKDKLSGETDYKALLKINRQQGRSQMAFSVDSDLQGIKIDLPEPLKKSADEKLPVHIETKTIAKSALSLWFQYAKKFTATLNFGQDLQQNWTFKQADIQLGAKPISLFGIGVTLAHIQISPLDEAWAIEVDSPNILGELIVPKDLLSPLEGEFDRFRLISDASKVAKDVNPGNIPPLNLRFKDFYYKDSALGQVSLLTSSGKNTMQIQRLKIDAPDLHISARGVWRQNSAAHQQTTISGNLWSKNIGTALKTWQVTNSLMDGEGRMAFALSWPAAAYAFSFEHLNGSFSLDFKKGRIINISDTQKAEMGIGRILNLFSLQSIPRRLSLDFSDLLQKGFTFDQMKGEFNMKDGDASTENAYLDGPIAKVAIQGNIGMVDKDYDLRMMITPYVTASLPIAATIMGGPIAGAATWLGSKVFSKLVDSMTMHTYQVTGPWDKPTVETVTAQ